MRSDQKEAVLGGQDPRGRGARECGLQLEAAPGDEKPEADGECKRGGGREGDGHVGPRGHGPGEQGAGRQGSPARHAGGGPASHAWQRPAAWHLPW